LNEDKVEEVSPIIIQPAEVKTRKSIGHYSIGKFI